MNQDHIDHRERVRQRFVKDGNFDSFHPHEVLEMLLFYSIPRIDTKPIAKELLRHFGSVSGVLEATPQELMGVKGIGEKSAAFLSCLTPLYRYYLRDRWGSRPNLARPSDAANFCTSYFTGKRYEELIMVCMTGGFDVIHVASIATGTIDEMTVYPRIAAETALRHKAQTVILAHNHPGGSSYASPSDVSLTHLIRATLSDIDIRLLDHFVVFGEDYISVNQQVKEIELNHAKPDLRLTAEPPQKGSNRSREEYLYSDWED